MHPMTTMGSTLITLNVSVYKMGFQSVCLSVQPWHHRGFEPSPNPQNKGTCSTGLETGCKPVLFGHKITFGPMIFWSSGYYFLGRFVSVLEPSLSGIIVLQNALFCLWQYPSRNQTVSIEPNFQSMLKQQVDLAIQSVMEEKSGKRADLWCRAKFTKQLWVM